MENNSYSFKTFIITLGRSIEKIVLLFSSIILSRYLSQNDYGSYRQVFLITGLIITIFIFGIPYSINYFVPQLNKKKQKSFIAQTIIFQMCLGFFSTIILYLGAGYISGLFNNIMLEKYLKLFALYPLFFLPVTSYSNIFICINKAKLSGLLSPILGFIRLSIILLSVLLKFSIEFIFIALVLFSIIQFLLILFLLFKNFYGIKLNLSFDNLINQIKFVAPIGLSSILGIIIIKVDQIMISSYFPVEEYAIYSIGTLEIPFINILTVSAMAVLTPFLVKQYKNKRIDLFVNKWKNSLLKISYIIFPVSIFFMFFSEETIILLYTEKYAESASIFRIYLFKLLVKITFFGHILLALGKSKIIFTYTLITLIINITLNFLFIKVFGFTGPAIATVFSVFIISLLQLSKISELLKIKYSKIWPWSNLFMILFISIICGYISSLIKLIQINELLLIILGAIFFICSYFIVTQYILRKYIPSPLRIKSLLTMFNK
jgi:O-antigen/teichoic acid export membrane protein